MSIEPECRARWITRDLPGLTFQSEVMPAPCLRREFDCPAVFRKALVRIAAPGYCDLRLDGGRIDTGMDALDWIERGVDSGAGEVVVNSIDTDGVKQGFDLEMLDALAARVSVPIIASGGAGKMEDFAQLFTHPGIDAGLAASIFHTRQVEIRELKRYLRTRGVEMRI